MSARTDQPFLPGQPGPEPGPEEVLHVTIPAEDPGTAPAEGRLDRVLARLLPRFSRSRLQALIAEGRVACDGRTIDSASARVKPGSRVTVTVPAARPAVPRAQAIGLSIAWEDDQIIVVDKPAGMVVHPAAGNAEGTLVNALIAHCGASLSGIGGVARPGIVHRLDRDTSGLMVAAKTDAAHRSLAAQFADRSLSRTYLAVVRGTPRPREGVIDAPIGRSPRNRKKMAVVTGGRRAVTRYAVLRAAGLGASLVECRLETGRTHQIRVHMSHIGHPILGDPVYGGTAARGRTGPAARLGRQALHAHRLKLRHPATGETMNFESPLPSDIVALLEALDAPGAALT